MKLTEAEWKIMNVLWRHHPASARDIMERLGDEADWAYTTIKTMLSRLVEKGVLGARMRGNTAFYTPRLTRKEARRSALRGVLNTAFEGTFGTMMHFLVSNEELSEKERDEIIRLVKEQKKGKRGE
jgi:BlaI family penicillinase repressor